MQWTSNFRRKIEIDGTSLGLIPEQIDAYAVTQERFASLYSAARSPTQRTPSVMQAKDDARIALEAASRQLARRVGAHQGITMETRAALGLAMQKRGGYRRALPTPVESPRLTMRAMSGRMATFVLSDRDGYKRRKPRGAKGAIVWCFVGDEPPENLGDWRFAGQTTTTINRMEFDGRLAPGTRVWLTACWTSTSGKHGPPCEPMLTHVGYGGPTMPSPKSARMLVTMKTPRLSSPKTDLEQADLAQAA